MSVPEVQVEDRSGFDIDIKRAAGMAAALLVRLGYTGGELGVTYVTEDEMEELNQQYMGRTGSTDVLSFPLDASAMEVEAGYLAEIEAEEHVLLTNMMTGSSSDEVPMLLGDVVICPEVAGTQAHSLGNSAEQELCLLLIHGVLHIVGYDHESDDGEMEKMQGRLFEEMCRIL
ncbi:MAG: rRNA maturation RNase YbeY [Thermoleophilia bacterium]|nr:rRNA maturation RNase YbeY [Thermoleophilia bacterium]